MGFEGQGSWQVYQADADGDRYGDAWMGYYEEFASRLLDQALDADGDGLPNLDEYRWNTTPIGPIPGPDGRLRFSDARDTDQDGWEDGPEVHYWNDPGNDPILDAPSWDAMRLAPHDPDSAHDTDGDGIPDQGDRDSDDDGVPDGAEVGEHGTFPQFTDSDCLPAAPACPPPGTSAFEPYEGSPGSGDGLPDGVELAYWTSLLGAGGAQTDCDQDRIPNLRDADSDNDGLLDGEEVQPPGGTSASNPCLEDEDRDGLKDGDERGALTDPRNPDSDGDGLLDGWEVRHRFAPLLPLEADQDTDLDALLNLAEQHYRTDPRVDDTDADGLLDGAEVQTHGTNATWSDSDGDLMPDGWEVTNRLNPLDPRDARQDPDEDSHVPEAMGTVWYFHTNLAEHQAGTDPWAFDTDRDGASDGAETAEGTDPTSPLPGTNLDRDQDGLPIETELARGTRLTDPDTDHDGICDGGWAAACFGPGSPSGYAPGEVTSYRSNPLVVDSDGDGLSDAEEVKLFDPAGSGQTPDLDGDNLTAILDADSDGDELFDGEEVVGGTPPDLADGDEDGLTDYEETRTYRTLNCAPSPVDADTDQDGLLDGLEANTFWTNPCEVDTDRDGLTDAEEHRLGTHPLLDDTDRDRMPDGWEVANGLAPTVNDAAEDPDRDGLLFGLTNYEEYRLNTNPRARDTDSDAMDDYWEHALGFRPDVNDAEADSDWDHLLNPAEYLLGTDPNHQDSDGDGLTDGSEAGLASGALLALGITITDPTNADTDNDGLADGLELALWSELGPDAWKQDYDGDGIHPPVPLVDGAVQSLSHNLRDPDADGDFLDDGQEHILSTRKDRRDTDGDGDTDHQEIMVYWTNATDPNSNHATVGAPQSSGTDTDGDRVTDDDEIHYLHTDPNAKDTDGDLLNDGDERVAWATGWRLDIDGDGTLNNLLDPDSDNDGLVDGLEFATAGLSRDRFYVTSPYDVDTDGDGLGDGEEDTNGLVGEGAARARQNGASSPPEGGAQSGGATSASSTPWWTGIDELGPHVKGAFGIKLYAADPLPATDGTTTSAASPGRGSGNKPPPDTRDADGDGLTDGTEQNKGSNWAAKDTDGDTLPDHDEPWGDTDGDGIPDVADDDSDADTLPDGDERPQWGTDPYDADTDDDGRCDDTEVADLRLPADAATNPDSDGDGVPDGTEERLIFPCGRGTRTDWTDPKRTLAGSGGRRTWIPYAGNDHTVPADPVTGEAPIQLLDFDKDGILDGIEDWNANGRFDEGESNWEVQDTDKDRIPDSIEILLWGADTMTFPSYLRYFVDRGLSVADAREAARYHPGELRRTNPVMEDTDLDGIVDGADLNPNGLAPPLLVLSFEEFRISDPIDPPFSGFSRYSLEPWIRVALRTPAGDVTLETPVLPEIEVPNAGDIADLRGAISGVAMDTFSKTGGLTDLFNANHHGNLGFRLPEDFAKFNSDTVNGQTLDLDTAEFNVLIGDGDDGDKDAGDIIDVNGQSNRDRTYHVMIKLGTDGTWAANVLKVKEHLGRMENGDSDGAAWYDPEADYDDSGMLLLKVYDYVWGAWLERATQVRELPDEQPALDPPVRGQSFGIG